LLESLGNDGQGKRGGITAGNRQADAVNGDGAFFNHKANKIRGSGYGKKGGIGIRHAGDDGSDSINVPGNEVTAKTTIGSHGPFQVDRIAFPEQAKGGSLQGFSRNVKTQRRAGNIGNRQTDTIDRDAVSQVAVPEDELPADGQFSVTSSYIDTFNIADLFNNASEHDVQM